jgi:vancomycin resistance protein VanW
LGLDATVVWPYKDLRLRNGLGVPVQFRFQVTDATIRAGIFAPAPVAEARLEITRVDDELRREVHVWRYAGSADPELISRDSYIALR